MRRLFTIIFLGVFCLACGDVVPPVEDADTKPSNNGGDQVVPEAVSYFGINSRINFEIPGVGLEGMTLILPGEVFLESTAGLVEASGTTINQGTVKDIHKVEYDADLDVIDVKLTEVYGSHMGKVKIVDDSVQGHLLAPDTEGFASLLLVEGEPESVDAFCAKTVVTAQAPQDYAYWYLSVSLLVPDDNPDAAKAMVFGQIFSGFVLGAYDQFASAISSDGSEFILEGAKENSLVNISADYVDEETILAEVVSVLDFPDLSGVEQSTTFMHSITLTREGCLLD